MKSTGSRLWLYESCLYQRYYNINWVFNVALIQYISVKVPVSFYIIYCLFNLLVLICLSRGLETKYRLTRIAAQRLIDCQFAAHRLGESQLTNSKLLFYQLATRKKLATHRLAANRITGSQLIELQLTDLQDRSLKFNRLPTRNLQTGILVSLFPSQTLQIKLSSFQSI